MVESYFPADFLKAWNHSNVCSSKTDAKGRLDKLIQFLKTDVEGEERISLAVSGFGLTKFEDDKHLKKKTSSISEYLQSKIPTAAGLLIKSSSLDVKKLYVFCPRKHLNSECFSAHKMSLSKI